MRRYLLCRRKGSKLRTHHLFRHTDSTRRIQPPPGCTDFRRIAGIRRTLWGCELVVRAWFGMPSGGNDGSDGKLRLLSAMDDCTSHEGLKMRIDGERLMRVCQHGADPVDGVKATINLSLPGAVAQSVPQPR